MEILSFLGPQEIILILIAVPVLLVLPVIALVDILKSEFTGNNKIIWVLVIIFLWLFGAVLYYFIGRKQKLSN